MSDVSACLERAARRAARANGGSGGGGGPPVEPVAKTTQSSRIDILEFWTAVIGLSWI